MKNICVLIFIVLLSFSAAQQSSDEVSEFDAIVQNIQDWEKSDETSSTPAFGMDYDEDAILSKIESSQEKLQILQDDIEDYLDM